MSDLKIDTNITREVSPTVSFTWNKNDMKTRGVMTYDSGPGSVYGVEFSAFW